MEKQQLVIWGLCTAVYTTITGKSEAALDVAFSKKKKLSVFREKQSVNFSPLMDQC